MQSLVDTIAGSGPARERTKVILLTVSGKWSVQWGCKWLGIGRTRFQDLRRRLMRAAVASQEERAAGRPRTRMEKTCRELLTLRRRVSELEHELSLAQVELEIARSAAAPAVARRVAAKGGRR